MLKILCNITSQKNALSNEDNNFFNIIWESDLYKSIFNQLNQCLLNKEVEFDNVITEKKKKNNKDILCANFIIDNLLYFFNKKDIVLNHNNFSNIKKNIQQKKKIDFHKNIFLETDNSTKKIQFSQKQKIKEKLKIEPFLRKLINNKNQCNQIDNLNSTNTLKDFNIKKLNDQFFKKEKNIFYIKKKNTKHIKYKNKIVSPLRVPNKKNTLFLSKNINKINHLIIDQRLLYDVNKKENITSDINASILNDSKNSIKWKKIISQKIFLSISNKENQAEIYLKPKCLGSIKIIINMKNEKVILHFISKNNNVRIFLDSCIPFLRDSLNKNSLKLEKFSVCSSFKNYKLNNSFYKNVLKLNPFSKELNTYEKKSAILKYKLIDMYV